MFEFRPRSLFFILLAAFFASLFGSVHAAFNPSLDYGLNLVSNSEKDNQVYSTLQLRLDDEFNTPRFEGEYDLNSILFFDHDNSDTNDQHRGRFTSQYFFARPSAWWNLDASVDVLPVASEVELDDFSSQNLTRLYTGPEISIWNGMRGSLNLSAEASSVDYSEANLDSKQNSVSLIYNYVISPVSAAGLELDHRRQEYEHEIHRVNDFDWSSAGIFFTSRRQSLDYRASAAINEVESDRATTSRGSFELGLDYRINASSSLSAAISDSLQTADIFNLLPGNLNAPLFESGLLRNQRSEVRYTYSDRDLFAAVEVFANEVENLVSSGQASDEIDGWSLKVTNRFSDKLRFSAFYQFSNTRSTDRDDEDLDMALTYSEAHAGTLTSEIGIFSETDFFGSDYTHNYGVRYRLTANLLR